MPLFFYFTLSLVHSPPPSQHPLSNLSSFDLFRSLSVFHRLHSETPTMVTSSSAPSLSFTSSILLPSSSHKSLTLTAELATLPVLSFIGDKVGETFLDLKSALPDSARTVVHRAVIHDLQNKPRGTTSTSTRTAPSSTTSMKDMWSDQPEAFQKSEAAGGGGGGGGAEVGYDRTVLSCSSFLAKAFHLLPQALAPNYAMLFFREKPEFRFQA